MQRYIQEQKYKDALGWEHQKHMTRDKSWQEMHSTSENRATLDGSLYYCELTSSDRTRIQERAQNINGFIDLSPFNQYNAMMMSRIILVLLFGRM